MHKQIIFIVKFENYYNNTFNISIIEASMKVLLEASWNATDIKDYCSANDIECIELSVDDLYNYDSKEFIKCTYFCNTDIVHKHFEKLGIMHLIPDTYDPIFTEFYKRNIKKERFGNLKMGTKQFIKPTTNNKKFDGQVIESLDDFLGDIPSDDDLVYISDAVTFVSEYRLLIGDGKLYGHGFICKAKHDVYMDEMNINKLIELAGERYLCIDIGYIIEPKPSWVIIEINPPFSLDDYSIPFNDYMSFCIDACQYLAKTHKSQKYT